MYSEFNHKDMQQKAIKLYKSYKSGKDLIESFEKVFDINYYLNFGKVDPKIILFQFLQNYYQNEFFIKHYFIIKHLIKTKSIFFDEYPILDVRGDLISLSKCSRVYEIKTEFDNLDRLNKQVNTYLTCFEYVYVICDEKKKNEIQKIIPEECGIYTYKHRKNCAFIKIKDAIKSKKLDSNIILSQMSKEEKAYYYKTSDNLKVLEENSLNVINSNFKKCLKNKYLKKCDQLKTECEVLREKQI